MLSSNGFERNEAIVESERAKTQSWINFIFLSLFFLVAAFISDFIGIGDWIRRNAIWFMLFAIGVVELDYIGSIDRLWLFIKRNSENEQEDLMQRIGHLEVDVNYIKNTVKELKERR